MTQKLMTKCGKYGVDLIRNGGREDDIIAMAFINDGDGYGGTSYWFTIGHYANEKNAIRQSAKKMAAMGKELNVA